jgi:hypothetical protein
MLRRLFLALSIVMTACLGVVASATAAFHVLGDPFNCDPMCSRPARRCGRQS